MPNYLLFLYSEPDAFIWLSLFLLLLVPTCASSQDDKFLKRLQGDWEGDGKALGGAARLRIKWEWVLENKFLRLSLKSEMTGADGAKRVFEGQEHLSLVI